MKTLNFQKYFSSFLLIGGLIVFASCSSEKSADETDATDSNFVASVVKPVAKKEDVTDNLVTPEKLTGVWTDGTSLSATYEFKNDSIYDLEKSQGFKYQLEGQNIKISHPGKAIIAKISFDKNYLIIEYADGPEKLWRTKK